LGGSTRELPDGGWVLLIVPADGTLAVFGSHRHATRRGSVATVWLRYEYRGRQSTNGFSYKSAVERFMYDCERVAGKSVSSTFYSENNLGEAGQSYVYDEGKVAWTPVIPGTVGESLLEWACKTTSGAQSAKTQ
jgi:hypothetical protein